MKVVELWTNMRYNSEYQQKICIRGIQEGRYDSTGVL